MRKVTINRAWSGSATIGILTIEDEYHPPIYTLERKWCGNGVGLSCIPSGLYKVAPFSGKKYKDVYQVLNVVGRSYILLHVGNFLHETQGCILIGLGAKFDDGLPFVTNSRDAFETLRKAIGNNEFWLKINDAKN